MLILVILKWIGIVLLSLLGLILLFCLYFLCGPITFLVKINFDTKSGRIKVYDFFRGFTLCFKYMGNEEKDKKTKISLGFLGNLIKLNLDNKKKASTKKEENKTEKKEEKAPIIQDKDIKGTEKKNKGKKKESNKEKNKQLIKLLKSEQIKPTYKKIFKELGKILKHISPRYFKSNCEFSTGSPDTTGYAVGAMSLIPLFYLKKVKFYPDFLSEKAYINGYIIIKGHINLVFFAGVLIRLFADKGVRKILHLLS